VKLHVDVPTLLETDSPGDHRCELEDGTRVSAETARRLTCDASIVRVLHAPDGRIVDVERKTRTISPALRRALEARDRGCRFPGCGSRFCDAHHIQHWADGGATSVENLILLCRRHHRLLHEGGFHLEMDPAGTGRTMFFSPRGIGIPEAPPRMSIDGRKLERDGGTETLEWERDVPMRVYLEWMHAMG
jgi:hypothetical protein